MTAKERFLEIYNEKITRTQIIGYITEYSVLYLTMRAYHKTGGVTRLDRLLSDKLLGE